MTTPNYATEIREMAEAAAKAHGLTLLQSYGVMLDTFVRMRDDPEQFLNTPDDLEPMIFATRDAALAERKRLEARPDATD